MAKRTKGGDAEKKAQTTAEKILDHFNARDGSGVSLSPYEETQLAAEVDTMVETEVLKLGKNEDLSIYEFSSDVVKPIIGTIHTQKFDGNKLKCRSAERFVKTRMDHWQSFIRGAQRLKKLQVQMESVAQEQM